MKNYNTRVDVKVTGWVRTEKMVQANSLTEAIEIHKQSVRDSLSELDLGLTNVCSDSLEAMEIENEDTLDVIEEDCYEIPV